MSAPDPTLDLYTFVLLTGIVPGFLLSILLFSAARSSSANFWLGLLSLLLTLSLLEVFLNHSRLMVRVMVLYNFSEPLQFLLGPALYFYQRSLSGTFPRKTYGWHFIPFVLFTGYMMIEFTAPEAQKYNSYIANYIPEARFLPVDNLRELDPLDIRGVATTIFVGIHLLTYVLLTIIEFRKVFVKRAPANKKKWIRQLLSLCIAGALVFIISKFALPSIEGENIVGVYMSFLIYAIGYLALQDAPFLRSSPRKYGTSSLSESVAETKVKELKALMDEEPLYLQNDLSLEELAKKLRLSEHHLSQVINEHLQTNFFGLINQYRVEKSKEYLSDSALSHLKIEEIGYKVGYNSKSAFFTAFKRAYGMTPQAWRNHAAESSD